MHDYFEIVGLSPDAGSPEVRRLARRPVAPAHPDFDHAPHVPVRPAPRPDDAAIDFGSMTVLLPKLRQAFFHARPL